MLSTRWQPFVWNQLERFQSEVNQLLDRVGLGQGNWPSLSFSFPPVNVWDDDEPRDCLPVDEALANAPEREGGFFKVPPGGAA